MNEAIQAEIRLVVDELERVRDDEARRRVLNAHRRTLGRELVEVLAEEVAARMRVDASKALALGRAARMVAEDLDEPEALAFGLRSLGNGLRAVGDNVSALENHERAAALFEQCGNDRETARTLSTSLQARILLGDYTSAFSAAEKARALLAKLGDTKRLARLDINVGNILHRQDRFSEALPLYEGAYRTLSALGDVEGVAAALSNIFGCHIMLNDFGNALESYREARKVCAEHGMPRLVARADYNIAYMYYLRGEYSRSIEMINAARQVFKKSGDEYHGALCDMDQAEIYLDLNLYAEAARLASRSAERFRNIGTGYEKAKSHALEAIALSNQGRAMRALDLFAEARESFVAETNQVWPWTIDLYRALVFYDEGRIFEAHRFAKKVLPVFEQAGLIAKAIVCRLLLARLAMRMGDLETAVRQCEHALQKGRDIDAPLSVFQAYFLKGQIEEERRHYSTAFLSFETAATTLESLRSSLQREEMKIAFSKNRLGVYEALVDLCLMHDRDPSAMERALAYIEQSKARALIDLILGSIRGRPYERDGQSELARRVQLLREELNWYYRRIEHEQLSREGFNPERVRELSLTAKARENELLDALRELPEGDGHFAGLKDAEPVSLERIQNALGRERSMVEYYIARGRIYACIITGDSLNIRPLAVADRVKDLTQRLQFQISKFQLPSEYVDTFESPIYEATLLHLSELYTDLLEPVRSDIEGTDLVIVPHSFLHYLPFHALFDGQRYVIDDFAVSYAPSASLFVHSQEQEPTPGERTLILGVPDRTAPHIRDEIESVAAVVPSPELLVGKDASIDALRERARFCRVIHVATHGYHRKDNPMFSAIRLGDGYLSLYDLYELSLPVELVTVSACATGLSVVVEGDELLGLLRGLLYAGARSLVATLWNVQDETTASLMRSFYEHLGTNADRAAALRCAMLEQREKTPQPFNWAPYVLVGKVGPAHV